MITASWSIEVQRPPEDVFDFVADLDNEPQFNPDASNIVRKTHGAIGLGTVYEEDYQRIGHYVTTIDVYERPSKLGFDARNPKTDGRVRFEFAPAGEAATTVSCTVELTMKGAMRLMEPMVASKVRSAIVNTRGPMLKAALEEGSQVTAQENPERHSSSADSAAIRWGDKHPDEDVEHPPPSSSNEDEEVVPNRHSASAEAASLRWHEQHDDE